MGRRMDGIGPNPSSNCSVFSEEACAGDAEWCVDFGGALSAMTTDEVHSALRSGDLPRDVRVWGEGLACWMRADEVPELLVVLSLGDAAVTPPAVEIEVEQAASLKAGRDSRVLMSAEALGDADVPVPCVSKEYAARGQTRPQSQGFARRFGRSDWMWVAVGAIAAFLFVGVSLWSPPVKQAAPMARSADLKTPAQLLRRQAAILQKPFQGEGAEKTEPGQKRRRSAQKPTLR